MSTTVIATTAATSAAIAADNAARAEHNAKLAMCATTMPTFEHITATVEQQRQYADCVYLAHPNPASPETVIAFKLIVALHLLGAVVGGLWGAIAEPYDRVLSGIGGVLAGLTIAFGITALVAAIQFLFS